MAAGSDRGGCLVSGIFLSVGDHDLRAEGSETLGEAAAETSRATGNDGDFAGQRNARCVHASYSMSFMWVDIRQVLPAGAMMTPFERESAFGRVALFYYSEGRFLPWRSRTMLAR